jgi:hypothetical protein
LEFQCASSLDAPLLQNCDLEIGPLGVAHDALGNLLSRMRSRPIALAELTRTAAGDVAENAAEGAETGPAGLERDLCNRQVGVAQQRRGALDAAGKQVAMWGQAERLLELAREVRRRDRATTAAVAGDSGSSYPHA